MPAFWRIGRGGPPRAIPACVRVPHVQRHLEGGKCSTRMVKDWITRHHYRSRARAGGPATTLCVPWREENIAVVRPSKSQPVWMRPPPTDSLAAVVLRGAAFRSDFNETACVPTPPASRCPIRHNIDGCTAAIPAVNALARVEQRRGHYRCDANALLPQLAATRSLVSHVIVPLEALGNTVRWLGYPASRARSRHVSLGSQTTTTLARGRGLEPLSLSTYRCTCTSRKVAADDARV